MTIFLLFYRCAAQGLSKMQTALPRKRRILPALPRTLYVEPGILGESRMSRFDDFAGFRDDSFLVFSFSRSFYSINFAAETLKRNHKLHG